MVRMDDPETSLHLYQIYVLPVLLYGMEVVFPRPTYMEVLEKFNKHNLKHIMSLPVTTADPAVYILSGNLPIEAMIHQLREYQQITEFFIWETVVCPSIGCENIGQ